MIRIRAVEAGHGLHRSGGQLYHRGGDLLWRHEWIQHRDVDRDPVAGQLQEASSLPF
jgi:hypothetical protein